MSRPKADIRTFRHSADAHSLKSSACESPLWSWRGEWFPLVHDVNHVQFDGLISRAFIVNDAVGKCKRLVGAHDLFRLAVYVQPEVALGDLCHYHARMAMPPGLETSGDL